jgi:hypothetical protein
MSKIVALVEVLFLSICVVSASGCKSRPGAPRGASSTSAQLKALSSGFDEQGLIKAYASAPIVAGAPTEKTKRSIRDEYISTRLTLIDLYYQDWTHGAAFHKQVWDTATDLAVLGVNAAGTLVGAAETKAILHAVSGGVVGSKLAVDKNFFYEKTVPALVAAMEAERQKRLTPIIRGSQVDSVEGEGSYPLSQAVIDLNAYYFAGTFLGAINGIQTESASTAQDLKKVNANEKLSSADQEGAPNKDEIKRIRAVRGL